MEFKIFRNIENGFKQIRMYAIAFAVLCSGVSIFAVGYAYYFAKQFITRASNITERSLITSCRLINSVRSDNNPQGFIIEQFNVIENKDLRTVER